MDEDVWIRIFIEDGAYQHTLLVAADWFDEMDDPAAGLLRWWARYSEFIDWPIRPFSCTKRAWWFYAIDDYLFQNKIPYEIAEEDDEYRQAKNFTTKHEAWKWALQAWRNAYQQGKLTELYPYKLETVNT